MTTSNEFGKYYKTISNAELLGILENPSDYQMAAIEAARNEFLARQLSDEELKEAREILNANQSKKEKQKQKIKYICVWRECTTIASVDAKLKLQLHDNVKYFPN